MTPYLYEDYDWEEADDLEIVEMLIEKHPEMFDYGMPESVDGKHLSWDEWMDRYANEKNEEDILMGHLIDVGEG